MNLKNSQEQLVLQVRKTLGLTRQVACRRHRVHPMFCHILVITCDRDGRGWSESGGRFGEFCSEAAVCARRMHVPMAVAQADPA